MAVRVLTIIITHNGESFIEECLNSVLNSAFNSDIFVIDNASQDSTIAILNNFGDKIYCKLLKTNIGFGRANNLGMKFAVDQNYDFVFLLNQDALVQKEAIGQLVYDAIKLDKCGIISPIHLDESGLHLDPNHLFHLQTISKLIHTECDFLRPFRAGETYQIEAEVIEFSSSSFVMQYQFTQESEKGANKHALVKMVHTCLDQKTFQKTNLPENVRQSLSKFYRKSENA